jgi:hypothetical protein
MATSGQKALSFVATNEDTEQEAERYRRAADETLEQLDWCEDYLYRIGKPEIAKEIAKNRSMIRRRMRGDD